MNKDYVYKRRLLKLADFLHDLPSSRFDYGQWVDDDYQGKPDISCGSKACALGWATTIPSLRKAGLRLKPIKDIYRFKYVVCLNKTKNPSVDSPCRAAKEVFGLSIREFGLLFIPSEYNSPSPKQVSQHIRNFVEKKYPSK